MTAPTISLPALRFVCVGCGEQTDYFPPRGGSDAEDVANDVCRGCRPRLAEPLVAAS